MYNVPLVYCLTDRHVSARDLAHGHPHQGCRSYDLEPRTLPTLVAELSAYCIVINAFSFMHEQPLNND